MALSSVAQCGIRTALCDETTSKEVIDTLNSIKGGIGAASGVASVSFATGLTTIVGFSVMQLLSTAPTTSVITATISGGTVTLFFWKATSAGNTTLVASTADVSYRWIATGTV